MRKKRLIFFLSVAMALTMVACSGNDPSETNSSDTTAETPLTTDTEHSDTTDNETSAITEAPTTPVDTETSTTPIETLPDTDADTESKTETETEPETEPFRSNLTDWTSDQWYMSDKGLTLDGTGGNAFAFSSGVTSNSFEYSGVATFTDAGGCLGLVFAIPDKAHPEAKWYCANITTSGSNIDLKMFANAGGESWTETGSIPAFGNSYKLKVTYDGKELAFTVGDLTIKHSIANLAPGAVGVVSWVSAGSFNDLNYYDTTDEGSDDSNTFNTNLNDWTSDQWYMGDKGLTLDGTGGNAFAFSSGVTSNSFEYSGVATFTDAGGCLGLVFAIPDKAHPEAKWYCANITTSGSNIDLKMFANAGGESWTETGSIPASGNSYQLKVTYDGKTLAFTVGDLTITHEIEDLAPGAVGIVSWVSAGSFNDLYYYDK